MRRGSAKAQRRDEHGIDVREHRRIGANAEGQHEPRDDRESRVPELTQREPEITDRAAG
jgi:hypothetical protein